MWLHFIFSKISIRDSTCFTESRRQNFLLSGSKIISSIMWFKGLYKQFRITRIIVPFQSQLVAKQINVLNNQIESQVYKILGSMKFSHFAVNKVFRDRRHSDNNWGRLNWESFCLIWRRIDDKVIRGILSRHPNIIANITSLKWILIKLLPVCFIFPISSFGSLINVKKRSY